MTEYTREQLGKLYKGLPDELKDWIASDDANDAIYQVLKENDVLDEKCKQVSILTRNVLFGLLPMENFQETIEKEVGLKKDLANKISHGINRFVFFPVKSILNSLYKIESTEETQKQAKSVTETEETKPIKSDSYLEPME